MAGITPSQTVGPFFRSRAHAREGLSLASADRKQPDHAGRFRRAHPHRRPRARRRRRAGQRRHDRDLAGRRGGPLRASRRQASGRMRNSPASAAPEPTPKAASASAPSSRAPLPGRTASRRRRISWSRSSPAACRGMPIRGSISPTRRAMRPIRSLRWCPPDRRGTLIAQRERKTAAAGLCLRHPAAGRERDGVF